MGELKYRCKSFYLDLEMIQLDRELVENGGPLLDDARFAEVLLDTALTNHHHMFFPSSREKSTNDL